MGSGWTGSCFDGWSACLNWPDSSLPFPFFLAPVEPAGQPVDSVNIPGTLQGGTSSVSVCGNAGRQVFSTKSNRLVRTKAPDLRCERGFDTLHHQGEAGRCGDGHCDSSGGRQGAAPSQGLEQLEGLLPEQTPPRQPVRPFRFFVGYDTE